jgi:hypothetical protein
MWAMRVPSATELLTVWERAMNAPPTARALAMLAAALPQVPWSDLAELPIGIRDRHLMRLRERMFGLQVAGVSQCPRCHERLELEFSLHDVGLNRAADSDATFIASNEAPIRDWCSEDYAVTFRLANSKDLLALANAGEESTAAKTLLARCIIDARKAGESVSVAALPDSVIESIAHAMGDADPDANTELKLTCPSCQHKWASLFDIGVFLWEELQTWAYRTLHDVHALARAYGWSESSILAMSATRRQTYLELLRS